MFYSNSLCSKLQMFAIAQKLYAACQFQPQILCITPISPHRIHNQTHYLNIASQYLKMVIQRQMIVTVFMNFFQALQLGVTRNYFRFLNQFWVGYEKIKNHH